MPQIPTSASEVTVRTLASDIELMGQSGGLIGQSLPHAMQVPVAFKSPAAEEAAAKRSLGKVIAVTALVILGIFGLFALGYFVLGQ